MTLDGSKVCDDAAPSLLPDVPLGELKPGEKVCVLFLFIHTLLPHVNIAVGDSLMSQCCLSFLRPTQYTYEHNIS